MGDELQTSRTRFLVIVAKPFSQSGKHSTGKLMVLRLVCPSRRAECESLARVTGDADGWPQGVRGYRS
jgi:hypothetical protein